MRILLSGLLLAVPSLAAADGVNATLTAERGSYELGGLAGDESGVRASVGTNLGRYRIGIEYALTSLHVIVPMAIGDSWSAYMASANAHRFGITLRARALLGTPLYIEAGAHRERTTFMFPWASWRDQASASAGLSFASTRGVGVEVGVRAYVGSSNAMHWSGWVEYPATDDGLDTSVMAYAGVTLGR